MRLVSWNVNGVRAVHQRRDLEWALGEGSEFDVVCLQETKASPEQVKPELRAPSGYRATWELGARKGYSGVATFVREDIPADATDNQVDVAGDSPFDNEGRVLCHDFGAFVLYNIYFPNGGRGPERLKFKLDFYKLFLARMAERIDDGREVVVCGDFNICHKPIDLARPDELQGESCFLPEERAMLDRLEDLGFVDTFRAEHGERPNVYSWWDVRKDAREINDGQRIDYFWVTEGLAELQVDAWVNANQAGSDHCPIGLELELDLG